MITTMCTLEENKENKKKIDSYLPQMMVVAAAVAGVVVVVISTSTCMCTYARELIFEADQCMWVL